MTGHAARDRVDRIVDLNAARGEEVGEFPQCRRAWATASP